MNCVLTLLMSGIMSSLMPNLPYANDALEPVISKETIDCHYGKHLQTYVNNLERFIQGTELENLPLEEIVVKAPWGAVYNNAGQVLNHKLYFSQFSPYPRSSQPEGELAEWINRDFGSFEGLKKKMTDASLALFGSGWVWLCMYENGKLVVLSCANGDNPLRQGATPLLGIDVWEHAYYLDYQNKRADHVASLWNIIDWDIVAGRAKR